jgi:acyl-CoA synthetase (AMP-forming)/AMP-acid ligase II
MHISNILNKAAQLWPNKEAIVCGKLRLTYKQCYRRVLRLAIIFKRLNVQPGSRVGILHHNCHVFLECYFAAALADLILVPINPRLAKKELGFILEDSGAEVLISNYDTEDKIKMIISEENTSLKLKTIIWTQEQCIDIRPLEGIQNLYYEELLLEEGQNAVSQGDATIDIAQLYYTSGTTGKPKGVMLTHDNVVTHSRGAIKELQLANTDVWGHIAPLYHLADAWATFAITMVGGKHVMVPKFIPALVLETIQNEGITISNLIPTMLNYMVNDPIINRMDFPKLRCILSGGAPIAPGLVKKIIETFKCEYIQTYGMTETSPFLTMSILKDHLRDLPEAEKFQYISKTGRPFTTIDLKVVDNSGTEVTPNNEEVGEIWVRGPTITPGYWNNPSETATAFCEVG